MKKLIFILLLFASLSSKAQPGGGGYFYRLLLMTGQNLVRDTCLEFSSGGDTAAIYEKNDDLNFRNKTGTDSAVFHLPVSFRISPTGPGGSSLGGGGVSDGDKGDITVSSSGSVWTIDNGVVSLAKMANVGTATVFYRKTAGTGAPEVQSLATLKTDLGLSGTNSGDTPPGGGLGDIQINDGSGGFTADPGQFYVDIAGNQFLYGNSGYPSGLIYANAPGGASDGHVVIGDVSNTSNATKLTVDDATQTITYDALSHVHSLKSGGSFNVVTSSYPTLGMLTISDGIATLGDDDGAVNSTKLFVDDVNREIHMNANGCFIDQLAGGGTQTLYVDNDGKITPGATPAGTVTNTGGALPNNLIVLGANFDDVKTAAGLSTDGVSKQILGVAGTSVGSIDFKNATSGTLNLAPPTGALGTINVTMPSATARLYGTNSSSITSAELATSLTNETGTTLAVFSDSPVFSTQITTPKIVGSSGLTMNPGSGATDKMIYQGSTNGSVTGTNVAHQFDVGNSAGTNSVNFLHNGNIGIGTTSVNLQGNTGKVMTMSVASPTAVGSGISMLELQGKYIPYASYGEGSGCGGFAAYNGSKPIGIFQFVLGADSSSGKMNAYYYKTGVLTLGWTLRDNGNFNIGANATPSARLHISNGSTTSAGTAPIKLTSGTKMTTPEIGAIEYDGTDCWLDSTGIRFVLFKGIKASATLNFGSIAAEASDTLGMAVTGANISDVVMIGPGTANLNLIYTAYVKTTNWVTIMASNNNAAAGAAIDPASAVFKVTVIK